jgi:transposase InsO family protein
LKVLHDHHDSLAAGHFGFRKTLKAIKQQYWWPNQFKFIKEYVQSCDTCTRAKSTHHKPYGLLQPLPIPQGPWQSISMDFITDLPLSNGFDSILVVVDRFTKMAHFIACNKAILAKETADHILQQVIKLHGLPKDIISDRGPQFASKFWARLFELLGTKINLSTAFHPQTDGQTERTNQTLEQYLRCTVDYQQDNWSKLLYTAEFAYNNSLHASTGQTPFFSNYGYHPRMNASLPLQSTIPAAEDITNQLQDVQKVLKRTLEEAQKNSKKFADKKRQAHPKFKIGDKV